MIKLNYSSLDLIELINEENGTNYKISQFICSSAERLVPKMGQIVYILGTHFAEIYVLIKL